MKEKFDFFTFCLDRLRTSNRKSKFIPKMLSEEIYLHSLRTILAIILFCLFYSVKKYLDNKPLGMQTILDMVVKDLLKILITGNAISFIGFGFGFGFGFEYINLQYRHYLALLIFGLWNCIQNAVLIQSIIFVVLRYLYVFYQTILDYFDDLKIIKCLRVFAWIVCITLTVFEVSNMNYRFEYGFITNQKLEIEINAYKIRVILLILCLITTIFVQVRIELFKKTVDFKSESNQMEAGNAEIVENHMNFEMSNNTFRFVMMLLCLIFLVIIDWILRGSKEADNVLLSGLRTSVIIHFILCNISFILVKRNPKMYKFCVNQCYFMYPRK